MSSNFSFSIFPNPCTSHLSLQFDQETELGISIIDQQGREVNYYSIQFGSGIQTAEIDISSLASGTYLLQIEIADKNMIYNKRFIKINDE